MVEDEEGGSRSRRGPVGSTGESSRPGGGSESDAELRLGTILQLEAREAGHGQDWRDYVAGRLLLPYGESPPFGLLAEPVPRDAPAAAAIATRWRVDADLLWLVVRTAQEARRAGRGRR